MERGSRTFAGEFLYFKWGMEKKRNRQVVYWPRPGRSRNNCDEEEREGGGRIGKGGRQRRHARAIAKVILALENTSLKSSRARERASDFLPPGKSQIHGGEEKRREREEAGERGEKMKHVRGERNAEARGRTGGTSRASAKKKKQRQRRKKARAKKERETSERPREEGGRGTREREGSTRQRKEVEVPGSRETFFREKRSLCEYFRGRAPNPLQTHARICAPVPRACAHERDRDGEKGNGGEKDKWMKKKWTRVWVRRRGVAR